MKRKSVEAKYEAALEEQLRMQIRMSEILDYEVIPEEEEGLEDKSTTTEEWHQETEEEETKARNPVKTNRDFESSSSLSGDETRRIEEKVLNFLKNSKDINEEKRHEVNPHPANV